jgi:hypothetical protein
MRRRTRRGDDGARRRRTYTRFLAQERDWLQKTDGGAWPIVPSGERIPVQETMRDIYARVLRRELKFAVAVKPLVG